MKRGNKSAIAAAVCSATFIVILGIAGYWERSIRVLHIFESLPYLAAATLSLRENKYGYALGFASGAFWLWTAGFLTSFIRNGLEQLALWIRTGSAGRLDLLIAVPAAISTVGLVFFSGMAYAGLPNKSWRDVGVLLVAMAVITGFFVAIFAAFAPQYLGMFHSILGR